MKLFKNILESVKPHFEEGGKLEKMYPAYDAFETFLFVPDHTTKSGSHIRDAVDLKRSMAFVVLSLIPCIIFGMWNIGDQYFQAISEDSDFLKSFIFGFWKFLPLLIVSYAVGLSVEFAFAISRGHSVNEGYLVSGMLIPLIMPIDVPLWMLAISVIFAVVIGKEVFGGTGMNILNPALTIRAFLFFAYPTWMSGDKVWVHGAVERAGTADAISGETILGSYAQSQDVVYSYADMFFGLIPGSVGETSKLLIIFGALFLIFTKVGSWRIILSTLIGAIAMGLIFNGIVDSGLINPTSKFYGLMSVPFWQHLIIGSILFGAVYMATDPVTASQTNKGKLVYGFLIGFISIMIRVFNPAYPEGVFLAILLMKVFAPTIDHYVIQGNVKRRMKRIKVKTA